MSEILPWGLFCFLIWAMKQTHCQGSPKGSAVSTLLSGTLTLEWIKKFGYVKAIMLWGSPSLRGRPCEVLWLTVAAEFCWSQYSLSARMWVKDLPDGSYPQWLGHLQCLSLLKWGQKIHTLLCPAWFPVINKWLFYPTDFGVVCYWVILTRTVANSKCLPQESSAPSSKRVYLHRTDRLKVVYKWKEIQHL